MNIEIATPKGWQAPTLPLAPLSSPTITPAQSTVGAFSQGLQNGAAATSGILASAEKISDALNPITKAKNALALDQMQFQSEDLNRNRRLRAGIDSDLALASGLTAGSQPNQSAAASVDASAPLPLGGASPSAKTSPTGETVTAAPDQVTDSTQPGATFSAKAPGSGRTVVGDGSPGTRIYGGNIPAGFYKEILAEAPYSRLVQDQTTTKLVGEKGDQQLVTLDKGGNIVKTQSVSGLGGGAVNPVTSGQKAFNQKMATDFADTSFKRQQATDKLNQDLDEYEKILKTERGTTFPGVGLLPFNDVNAKLKSLESSMAMNANTLKGSTSNKDLDFLLQSMPNHMNSTTANQEIINRLRGARQMVADQDAFIGQKMGQGIPYTEAIKQYQESKKSSDSASQPTAEDQQAIQWLKENPNDPSAMKVRAALTAKGLIGGK